MISIIIPAHNEYDNLRARLPYLEILIASFRGAAEVLVVVSKSTNDRTMDLPQGTTIQLVRAPGNGRALQMNYGARLARGKILVFLHADVIPPPEFLPEIANACSHGIEAGFFSYQFDSDSRLLRINAYFTGKDGIFTGGGDQCLFISRSCFDSLGGFDSRQVIMEDFEFFRRMKRAGVSYKIIRKDLLVSARKYQTNSYLRVNLANLLLISLFRMGWPSERLKRLHNRMLRVPYNLQDQEGMAPRA